jgi:phosphonate transport system permease protein
MARPDSDRAPAAPPPPPAAPAAGRPTQGWLHRLDASGVLLILLLVCVAASLPALRGSGRDIDWSATLLRKFHEFFPPDFSDWRLIVSTMGETFQIAVLATCFATLLSLPLAAAGSRSIAPRWVVLPTRFLMNAIRTVPSLVYALLAVAFVGANSLAGVLALTFYSMGYLGKFFSDAFESVDADVARGLKAIGASPVQAFQHGLWPHARPLVWSHVLWMLEYNVRSAAIIGYVGAGGVGVLLQAYQEHYRWERFGAVLCVILVLVVVLDFFGEWIRSRVARRLGTRPLAS